MHSNILHYGTWGVKGDATTTGTASLAKFAPGYLFTNNAIMYGGAASYYPTNNWFPATSSNVGFVSVSTGDYRLASTSTYATKGYDGRSVGADATTVTSKTAKVVVAP